MAKIISVKDVRDKLFYLHSHGNLPGVNIGFSNLDKHYTVKKGSSTIIYGHPTVGKSQFYHELTKTLTCEHGWKGLVYSPETGSADEIFAEIVHCLTGKTFDKRYGNYITEKELYDVLPFIETHYKIAEDDNEQGFGLAQWIELTKEAIRDYDISFSSIDNWNDLDHNLFESGGLISEYLKKQLPKVNKLSKINNIHSFIICHARNPNITKDEKFPKMPRPDEIEGGSVWYAKAMNLIGLHREYEERQDGSFEQSTQLTVDIKKVKPRIVGKKGRVLLNFDIVKNSYYYDAGLFKQYLQTPFNGLHKIESEFNTPNF